MRIESCLPWRRGRLTLVVLALACLAVWSVASPAVGAKARPAGSFDIPAWAFDRGNARVHANPDQYADVGPLVGGGDRLPWVVEYDVDFPVTATYTLHLCYASGESRPMDVLLDGRSVGKCGGNVTVTARYDAKPRPAWIASRAKWEEGCSFPVTKGKHTLKLTRQGPPPHLKTLRLSSPVAFPKGWKPPRRKLRDLSSIPAVYRTAFLRPGSVNVATLRLAIEDTIRTFGRQYPKGRQYLKQLGELEEQHISAQRGTPEQKEKIEDALASLRRQAMLAHPLLKFDRLLFVKRMTYTSSHIYTDHWDGSRRMGGNLCILSPVGPRGKVTEIAPELNGGLFGRFDLSFDAKKVVFAYKPDPKKSYRIYEIGIDPSTGLRAGGKGLRQLTFDADDEAEMIERYKRGYDDLDPCYLPNGKIMFTSTRSKRAVFCFPSTSTTLYVMDADGKNLRCLSGSPVGEFTPCVMDDGRVIYTRWEYVDKGFGNVQSLWSMYPDGSGSAHVYKNNMVLPAGMINARTIPGSNLIVTIGVPHCTLSVGPVILVDPRVTRRTAEAMTNITPEIGYPGMFAWAERRKFGFFKEPYPLSETFFLVAHSLHSNATEPTGYGIYVLDAWGNRAELYRDPKISCFQPTPLRPRRRPLQIPSVARRYEAKGRKPATLFMLDVYQGMTGIERGRVKYLRVMEDMALSWDASHRSGQQGDGTGLQASAVSLRGDVAIKKVHGIVAVHEDGSAYFTVPAEKNLFFQALDQDYMELQRMRTFVNLMPGEKRSCIGCHELRRKAPDFRSGRPQALYYPAQALRPQPGDTGPRTVHYTVDVRPILDKHCVGCHGGKEPKGDLDLSGELTKLFDRSYENLIEKQLISHLIGCYGGSNIRADPPLSFGSHLSKLVERIRKDPCKANLTREEFIRIVTWIDANAPYYGTHRGKKNLKWKDAPDFRPTPSGE